MIFVLAALVIGLAFATYRAPSPGLRTFLLACTLANAAAGIHMAATGHEYAWTLRPTAPDSWQENARP